jgi:replicative DNA helicase
MAEGSEPELHHLAQSGSLENDSDMVFLMHRPEKADPKHITLRLAKNRHGGYGSWSFTFEGEVMRYFGRSDK